MFTGIIYTNCPFCSSNKISPFTEAKDYTVSGELFAVYKCENCAGAFTQDIPKKNEIGRYYVSDNYVSHTDTKKGIINRLYHTVRNITLRSKIKLVAAYTPNAKGHLLDVGAGTGAFGAAAKKAGWNVTAIEPDAVARQKALENHGFSLKPAEEFFTPGAKTFDVITLWHVLEHIHDLDEYIQQFFKILKPDGILIIAVPNYTSYDAEKYGAYWAAYDVPRHLYHFSPQSLEQLMQKKGFALKACKPMWFDSFYVSMLSEKYKTGKLHLIRALWNGLVSNIYAISNSRKCSSVIYIFKKES